MPTDAHQVQPAKPSVSSPKGKTLADRLKQLITSFPEGHFASLKDAMHCGFELSCSLDNWNERNEQFLVERIHKYIAEDPGLQGMVEADFQRKLLYGFLWGYVLGQLASARCTNQEYANAKKTVRETMNYFK